MPERQKIGGSADRPAARRRMPGGESVRPV